MKNFIGCLITLLSFVILFDTMDTNSTLIASGAYLFSVSLFAWLVDDYPVEQTTTYKIVSVSVGALVCVAFFTIIFSDVCDVTVILSFVVSYVLITYFLPKFVKL